MSTVTDGFSFAFVRFVRQVPRCATQKYSRKHMAKNKKSASPRAAAIMRLVRFVSASCARSSLRNKRSSRYVVCDAS